MELDREQFPTADEIFESRDFRLYIRGLDEFTQNRVMHSMALTAWNEDTHFADWIYDGFGSWMIQRQQLVGEIVSSIERKLN